MKKLIFTLVLVLSVALGAKAQGWYMGGNVGFWRDTNAEVSTYNIAPDFGYVINDKWAAGAYVGYAGTKNYDVVTVAPYVRYTYWSQGIVSLFADATVGFDFIDSKAWNAGIKPGFALQLSEKFSIESHVGFLGYTGCYEGAGDKGFGLSLDSAAINFGFYWSF